MTHSHPFGPLDQPRNHRRDEQEGERHAELLDVVETAAKVIDDGKRAKRLGRAKGAHDALIPAIHRVQADALSLEAQAKRRLADEYDAAQARGEVAAHGGERAKFPDQKLAKATEIVSPKVIHEARTIRDAEKARPGIVRETVDAEVAAGREPTRTTVRKAVRAAAGHEPGKPKAARPRRRRGGADFRSARAHATLSARPARSQSRAG